MSVSSADSPATFNTLRIVMAQLNPRVGDIPANAEQVVQSTRRAIQEYQASLVVFPELMLTGYPPEDLLLRPALQGRIAAALETVLAARLPCWVAVGHPWCEEGQLYNAVSVIHQGEVVARYFKQHLPNHGVFDERRYFQVGHDACVVAVDGVAIGFVICEDLWADGPAEQAREAGADLLVCLNASPFHTDKLEQRVALLNQRQQESGLDIAYINMVGGQDELVFDGNSLVAGAQGVMAAGPAFEEQLVPLDWSRNGRGWVVPQVLPLTANPPSDADIEQRCYQAMVLGLRDYIRKNGFRSVILGLSGGIDSALTLAVAVDALGAENVNCVMMPFTYTSQLSLQLAAEQAERLRVGYRVIPIEDTYQAFADALADDLPEAGAGMTQQNIQARCRGVLLMALSNTTGALVLTTGNKSEIAVGYCTLYGDMVGAFSVLKDASKTLVYRLARYRNRVAADAGEPDVVPVQVIERPPSAELAPDQKDEDSLPPYERLDPMLALYVEQDLSAEQIIARGFDRDEVCRVTRLVDMSEYKRRQSAVGVRLTQRAFGRDRRYPITYAWKAGE